MLSAFAVPAVGSTGTALVQLTCIRADKTVPWTTPMEVIGEITETALGVNAAECTDTSSASTTITNTDKIKVNIIPQGPSSVCTTDSSATITYNITRDPAGEAPTVTSSSTGCSMTGQTGEVQAQPDLPHYVRLTAATCEVSDSTKSPTLMIWRLLK